MTSAPLEIRPVAFDVPEASAMIAALQDYYATVYDGPDPSPVEPAEFAPPEGAFFVGYLDGTPVAMGGWRHVGATPGIDAAQPAEIKRMYVAETARGRGLARQMLAHLELTAAAAGADMMVLSTGPAQPEAIALYRSSGYVDVVQFGFFAAYEQAVHLGKRLDVGSTLSEPRAAGTAR
jgi:GNAT superfamily N-acetyltransferase